MPGRRVRSATGSSTSTTSRSRDSDEELYLVLRGRATFELDGEQVDAPAGTFVFARPGVKRTAVAAEPETTLLALGGVPGKPYATVGVADLGAAQPPLRGRPVRGGHRARPRAARRQPSLSGSVLQRRLLRKPRRSNRGRDPKTSGARSSCPSAPAPSPSRTPTSIRSADEPAFQELVGLDRRRTVTVAGSAAWPRCAPTDCIGSNPGTARAFSAAEVRSTSAG